MSNFLILFTCMLVVIVALFLLVILLKLVKSNDSSTIENSVLPYSKKQYILTKAENNFFFVLNTALSNNYYICPKVRMSDILDITDKKNWQSYFNKITMKHVDFLVCENKSFKPVLAIELDDSSHNSKKVSERDDFVNKAYKSAGLPCMRVKASYSYTVEELREQFNKLVKDV